MYWHLALAGLVGLLSACLNPDISDEDPITMQADAIDVDTDAESDDLVDDSTDDRADDSVDDEASADEDEDEDEADDDESSNRASPGGSSFDGSPSDDGDRPRPRRGSPRR